MTAFKTSQTGELIYADIKRWAHNMVIFSIPLLIAYLTGVQTGLTSDESWKIFVIPAIINALIDITRKYQSFRMYER